MRIKRCHRRVSMVHVHSLSNAWQMVCAAKRIVRRRTYGKPPGGHPSSMNPKAKIGKARQAGEGPPIRMSAEGELRRELAQLAEWLVAQGLDLKSDAPHADEGSRDRLYWRYGYFAGLKQALAMLTPGGATAH
jgi:hypothetical protein